MKEETEEKGSARKEKDQHSGFTEAGGGVFQGQWSVCESCKEVTKERTEK